MRGAHLPAVMLAAWLGVAAACYQPTVPAGARCAPSGACPGGAPCIAGVCGGGDPSMPDASPDSPPGTMRIVIGEDRSQVRDAEVMGYDPDLNLGDGDHISVDPEIALLWFDLSGVPGGLTLEKATLRLHTTDDADENNGTVHVYRLLESWDEAEVTWRSRAEGALWAGFGIEPPSRGDAPIAELRPNKEFTPFDVELPVELVRAWLADPGANFGLAFVRGMLNQHVHFGSRESPAWSKLTLELRP